MQLHAWKSWSWLGAGLLALTVACGGDDSSDGDAEAGNSESGSETVGNTGDGDGDPTTTGDGDGDGDPTTTGDGDGDGDPTTTGDGDGDGDGDPTTTGDGDGDEPFPECLTLETQAECEANPNCQAVTGSRLKENGPDAPCLEPAEFMGCIGMQGCGDAVSWFCVGGNNTLWQVPDTCGPDGATPCDAPADPVSACP